MSARLTPDEQLARLRRGCVEIISEPELLTKLARGKPLVIKAGFDPTAPDLHLGHTVLLRKLRQFQDLGHKVIFLIGDATALVGDPSGQSQTRPVLHFSDIASNALTYMNQVSKILDIGNKERFVQEFNRRWFVDDGGGIQALRTSNWTNADLDKAFPFRFQHMASLFSRYTVARLVERDDFSKRLKGGKPVSMLELFYPLMQGYDSVMIGKKYGSCDVELGGTDQKFNLLVGRDLQKEYDQEQQVVITTPLLVGLDGVQKMSKSLGNHIGINEPPEEMFGKLMSISDAMMWEYFTLLTDEDVAAMQRLHPMEAKKRLATTIVTQYHDTAAVRHAQDHFERTVQNDETPAEVPQVTVRITEPADGQLVRLLALSEVGATTSRGEARRMIEQGGVKVDGQVVKAVTYALEPGRDHLIQCGKRLFRRVRLVSKGPK